MRMIDVALPKFGDDDKTPPTRPVEPTRMTTFRKARDEEKEIEHHLDEPSVDEDAKDEGKDEFFDTQDIADGVCSPL